MRFLLAAVVTALTLTGCTPPPPPTECIYWHPDGAVTGACP